MSPEPAPVRVEMRKWPDSPHWEFDALRLGRDTHGTWVGIREDTLLTSPNRSFRAVADHVTLIPPEHWWVATFYGEDQARPFDTYVDIATPARWHGEALVRSVDLDLDVIRGTTGRIWIDDEQEFAEHQVALAYPADLISAALDSTESVASAMRAGRAPFDGAHGEWLRTLRHLSP